MHTIHIKGGIPLHGTVDIYGAKNAALPLLASGLLTQEPLVLNNMPHLSDITHMMALLRALGAHIIQDKRRVTIFTPHAHTIKAPYDVVREMRASILVLGALLGRFGQAEVSLPGGCAIGVRPLNFHLDGLKALGVDLDIVQGYITAKAPHNRVPGGRYAFPAVSVTGTQNLIFAAVLAKGESCLANVALEPEITDLITCLQTMGARIEGKGTSTLHIQGVDGLLSGQHTVLPDRIEMGTFMIAAAITQGDLIIRHGDLSLLAAIMPFLEASGTKIESQKDGSVRVYSTQRPKAFSLTTQPYPGFPTDLQAQFMALATLAEGTSFITETIWENRFMHVNELARMGADINMNGNTACIHGQKTLSGAPVMATDLRASVGLVLAGLAAKGETILHRIYHIDRGYEKIEEKLRKCGADIKRLTSDPKTGELSPLSTYA